MKLCFYQHKTIVQHILGVNYSLNILILHISDVLSLSLTSDFPLHFMRSVIMIVILMTIFLEHIYRYLGQFFLDPTGSLELTLSVSAVSQCSFLIVENPSVKQIKLTDGIYTSSKSIYHFLT